MSSEPDPQLTLDRLGGGTAKIYSVSELVRDASRRLESRFADVWVEGEVSNLKTPSSGHYYFTLKDARSQLAVVMFRAAASRLGFRLQDGQKLRCRGRLGIYDAQGRFQLTAQAAEPIGLGALQLAFQQLWSRLQQEGLFDPSHKKPLPWLPRTVAIVTSPTGAALQDMIRVLHQRCPVRIVVCPTSVQGGGASSEIVRALGHADRLGLDLVILGRGGGSLEDLQAFNNEGVARALFHMCTPVISAVGHEVDLTIADLVADRRAPTPSAAAELAVPVLQEVLEHLLQQRHRLWRAMHQQLQHHALRLERLGRQLGRPSTRIDRQRIALDEVATTLQASMWGAIRQRREQLHRAQTRLAGQEPRARLARLHTTLDRQLHRLTTVQREALASRRARLDRLTARLTALDPLSILERGFSLVLDEDGRIVSNMSRVVPGQRLVVRLARGTLHVRVEQQRGDHEPADP